MSRLYKNDYINILKYYNRDYSGKSVRQIKDMAEKILAEKLCKCIKKVNKTGKNINESRAIALCKTSVLHKKGIKNFNFTCKKRRMFLPKKGTTLRLVKRNKK
jgi:hypothetical protein